MEKNTPKAKGVRTAIQTIGGALVTYLTGLIALPAVRDYTDTFVRTQGVAALVIVLAALGVSTGIISFIQNRVEDRNS